MLLLRLRPSSRLGLSPTSWKVSSEEEVIENVFRSHKLSLKSMMVALEMVAPSAPSLLLLFKCLFAAYLIVYASFVWVWKTSHSCIHLFKRISRFRCWIFVWMHLNCSAFKCFFQIVISTILLYSQHSIVVLAFDDLSANINILLSVGSLIFLRLLTNWRWLRFDIWLIYWLLSQII